MLHPHYFINSAKDFHALDSLKLRSLETLLLVWKIQGYVLVKHKVGIV